MAKKTSFLPEDARDVTLLFEKKAIKAYSMAVFTFFAFAFFAVFAIRPTLMSFFHLQRQIEDSKLLDEQLTDKINALLRAQEAYQARGQELKFLDESIPPDPEFPALVRKVEQVVAEEGATVTGFTANNFSLLENSSGEKDASIATISFTLSVNGDYLRAESILRRFSNLRRIITTDSVKFATEAKSESEEVELSINGNTYFSKL